MPLVARSYRRPRILKALRPQRCQHQDMAAQPITISTTLTSIAPTDEVLAQLHQLAWGPSARLEQPDSRTLHVSSGSKLRYRLLGVWSGSERLPLKATLQLDSREGDTAVRFTLTSNAGWYLMQTPLGRDAYQARFNELLSAMRRDGIVERT
jgi:hypothetical protein